MQMRPTLTLNKAGDKARWTTPLAILAVAALIGFLGWWGYQNFGPDPPLPLTPAARAYNKWFDKIAKDSGGDISKLSDEDMGKLQKSTLGHGAIALKGYAKEHGFAK